MRKGAENVTFFEDIIKIASGAIRSFADIKPHVKAVVYTILDELDVVSGADFERVEAIAEKALADNIKLEKRIKALELKLDTKKKKKPTAKKATTKNKAKKK